MNSRRLPFCLSRLRCKSRVAIQASGGKSSQHTRPRPVVPRDTRNVQHDSNRDALDERREHQCGELGHYHDQLRDEERLARIGSASMFVAVLWGLPLSLLKSCSLRTPFRAWLTLSQFKEREELPLSLLKFSGGSVTFYATFSTDTAMPSC
jgi:hypothetical protein